MTAKYTDILRFRAVAGKIMNMKIEKYYISLRSELLSTITGIKNSGFSLYWDNTTPNHTTRRKILSIYKKYLELASEYGLYMVTRHCECEKQKHDDYIISNEYGLDITYQDHRYVWEGQMFQGTKTCKCPCSQSNSYSDCYIIEDIIYDKNKCFSTCNKIYLILSDIYKATEKSKDNKPRSAVREYLLRAILQLNDEIMPYSVDEYINQHC